MVLGTSGVDAWGRGVTFPSKASSTSRSHLRERGNCEPQQGSQLEGGALPGERLWARL